MRTTNTTSKGAGEPIAIVKKPPASMGDVHDDDAAVGAAHQLVGLGGGVLSL